MTFFLIRNVIVEKEKGWIPSEYLEITELTVALLLGNGE